MSQLPESTNLPSGEKATELTTPECPAKERSGLPLDASQSLRVLSLLPEASWRPSGENATAFTSVRCPLKMRTSRCSAFSYWIAGCDGGLPGTARFGVATVASEQRGPRPQAEAYQPARLAARPHNLMFLGVFSFDYDANIHTAPSPWGAGVILAPVIGGHR